MHVYPKKAGIPIISITVLNSAEHLKFNGVFDLDKLYIPIDAQNKRLNLSALIDKHNGYGAWKKKTPKIVSWAEYQKGYPTSGIRVARTYAKCGFTSLPAKTIATFRNNRPNYTLVSTPELFREMLKLFFGTHYKSAINICFQLGVFEELPDLKVLGDALRKHEELPVPATNLRWSAKALFRARYFLESSSNQAAKQLLNKLEKAAPSVYPLFD